MGGVIRVGLDDEPVDVEYRRPPSGPAPAEETATEDVLIERPDLGPGLTTFIRKGDKIRGRLVGYPRRAA